MRGKKTKRDIKNIENKPAKSVAFSKRRQGLFRKASALCHISPETELAILATPLSSNSHASFYSFGYPSVDHVVSSLLHDHQPPLPTNQDKSLGFWWEDKDIDRMENVDELKDMVDAVTRMMNNVRLRLNDAVKSNQRDRSLVIHQKEEKEEEEVHQLCIEDAYRVLDFEAGETSASASLLDDAVKSNQRDKGLEIVHQEEVLERRNEETKQITIFEGETSASASLLLENEEDDNLHIDDLFSDFDIDSLIY